MSILSFIKTKKKNIKLKKEIKEIYQRTSHYENIDIEEIALKSYKREFNVTSYSDENLIEIDDLARKKIKDVKKMYESFDELSNNSGFKGVSNEYSSYLKILKEIDSEMTKREFLKLEMFKNNNPDKSPEEYINNNLIFVKRDNKLKEKQIKKYKI